jgi:hypothetical protein
MNNTETKSAPKAGEMAAYMRVLKVAAPLEALQKFQLDTQFKRVPGDEEDVRLAAYLVALRLHKLASINANALYPPSQQVARGLAWLEAQFGTVVAAAASAGGVVSSAAVARRSFAVADVLNQGVPPFEGEESDGGVYSFQQAQQAGVDLYDDDDDAMQRTLGRAAASEATQADSTAPADESMTWDRSEASRAQVLNLETTLGERVIGQPAAVALVARCVMLSSVTQVPYRKHMTLCTTVYSKQGHRANLSDGADVRCQCHAAQLCRPPRRPWPRRVSEGFSFRPLQNCLSVYPWIATAIQG